MTALIHPVLLCGGSGTRLWPLSRKSQPKQFVPLFGTESLFQATVRRVSLPGYAAPMIVTGDDFRFVVTQQLEAISRPAASVLIEPSARNTAPAVLAAALALEAQSPGALMLVAPSDHVMPDAEAFQAAVREASLAALQGQIVSFGIAPDRPETGYGWLELEQAGVTGPQPLLRFVEKPPLAKAEEMLASGRCLWNAGIFLFTTTTIIDAFRTHAPEMIAPVQAALDGARHDLGFLRLEVEAWNTLPDISIDYAVMEKAKNLSVMPYGGAWSDLGGWEATRTVWRRSGRSRRLIAMTRSCGRSRIPSGWSASGCIISSRWQRPTPC
jgi:mannose-1-phosphate guanylyltransferase/mannose-6-phosphate isomerase